MTEPEKVHERVALAVLLMVLAIGAWLLFASMFAADLTTYCGPDCVNTVNVSTWSLVWLGAAVTLTVFSGAAAVLAGVAAMHNKQMQVLLTRSSA